MGKKKAHGRRGGGREARAAFIASAEDVAARDAMEARGSGSEDSDDSHNSDLELELDFMRKATVAEVDSGEAARAATSSVEEDAMGDYEDVFRIPLEAPVFEKDRSLVVADLIESANPNAGKPLAQAQSADESEEEDEAALSGAGLSVEERADLERLEEIREERERAKLRREHEAKKKEQLRQKAAERAEALEKKAKGGAGAGGKKKKGKKR